ncbi:MAG: hypothetical protein HXX10_23245 [Rhodoplanes sp.]|uniref:HdeA/HdeB family chaperone n=1 Tax=Rhodoplanes sp. TaxID=1968906 RepID=UPI0017A200A3|nr:HdeA/HdeB family chaperone [Rhodoplanes sp.]NVO16953.1 hypothetical protein [Rhodoplanes sp.]
MNARRICVFAALLPWLMSNAVSADEHPVLGQGNVTCSVWLEGRQAENVNATSRTAWVLGYLTAYNEYGPKEHFDVSDAKSTEELTEWIDKYCQQHRENSLHKASAAFIETFAEKAAR